MLAGPLSAEEEASLREYVNHPNADDAELFPRPSSQRDRPDVTDGDTERLPPVDELAGEQQGTAKASSARR